MSRSRLSALRLSIKQIATLVASLTQVFCICSVLPLVWVQKQRRFKGFPSVFLPSCQPASQPDKSGCRWWLFPKNASVGICAPPQTLALPWGVWLRLSTYRQQGVFASLRLSFTSDCWLTHHQLETLCVVFFCGVSQASRTWKQKKSVISIPGFVTSVCCYATCELHKAAVSPGNMLLPPPRDESLSCPGVSGLPLRLCRLEATQDRPRLRVAWPMSHHFLLPFSILILSYILPLPSVTLLNESLPLSFSMAACHANGSIQRHSAGNATLV